MQHHVYYNPLCVQYQTCADAGGGPGKAKPARERCMNKFTHTITHHKKIIVAAFVSMAVICGILTLFVGVNYNMIDYLPPSAQSTVAIKKMTAEFGGAIPNAKILVKDVTITQALDFKEKLAGTKGVGEVLWLDDAVDVKKPLELADAGTVGDFYKDGDALFLASIEKGSEIETYTAIKELIGDGNMITGEAPDIAALQLATGSEVMNAFMILVPVIVLILILSSTSWIEPLLYLSAIGVSILINMGTNIFFGEISFMTNSVSPILQLAVSLDYAIFLLHSFQDQRHKCDDVTEAMRRAIKQSVSTVAASAATTLCGFIALVFMQFRIGADMGIVLAKGIILSFISVIIFLPAFTLLLYKLIDRTAHRAFMPSFRNVNRALSKLAIPAVIFAAIVIVPCYMGQGNTEFIYGNSKVAEESISGVDKKEIQSRFGQSISMVLLVPRGDIVKEKALSESLERLDYVTSVVSYTSQVGAEIPVEFLDGGVTSRFYSENYARFIIYVDTPEEGDLAFSTVERITETAKSYYGDQVWTAGQSANLYDMKNVVKTDNLMVNLAAIIAIFIVLLVTFKSAVIPFILLLTIETAIWINLSTPYFEGIPINFIGYLVISTVQLGATVDYAILLTTRYMDNRHSMLPKEAIHKALGAAFRSIMVSAAVLSTAGFTLYATSTNPAVSDLGMLLGRGTLLSFVMVVCFLPGMLRILDRVVAKATWHSAFMPRKNQDEVIKEAVN